MTGRNRPLVVADKVRRLYWRLLGPRTLGVRTIVLDERQRVLLVRHSYGAGDWHLPGGGVHRRETLEDAARRETWEETGVVVADGAEAMKLHGVFSNLREGKSDHIVVFEIVHWTAGSAPGGGEIAETRWFPLAEPPERASPGTARRLEELRCGARPGFRW